MRSTRECLGLVTALAIAWPAAAHAQEEDESAADNSEARPPVASGQGVAFDNAWLEPFFTRSPSREVAQCFRSEDWAGAIAAADKALHRLPRTSADRPRVRLLRALALEARGAFIDAAAEFESLHRDYDQLAAHHALHAARCRLRSGANDAALTWANKVPVDSVAGAEADLVRLDIYQSMERWIDVADIASAYLDAHPHGARRAEVLLRKAEAWEKLGRAAGDIAPLYRRVWSEAPLEKWAARAAERLDALAKVAPTGGSGTLATRSASEWLRRGMGLFDGNRNPESEEALAAALHAPGLDPDIECRARYHLAQSVWKQRQRPRAAPLFDEAEVACGHAGDHDLHAKALYQGARCQAAKGDRAGALARFARVEAEHADHSYADDARVRQAEVQLDAGEMAAATDLLATVAERYPRGDLLGEALWRLALQGLRSGDLYEARRRLEDAHARLPHEDIWYAEGRVLYWLGRVAERQARSDDAVKSYEAAVREYPLSVYALMSLERLRRGFPQTHRKILADLRDARGGGAHWRFAPSPLYGQAGFLRAVELARLGLGGEARRELARLGLHSGGRKGPKASPAAEDGLWIAAVLLDASGQWATAHGLPRNDLRAWKGVYPKGIDELKWRIAYPRGFPDLVARNARSNHIPEALQSAIIREESAWNPRIESFANAIGLTQMLVKTARRFSDGVTVTREWLLDPAHNLTVGSRFLAFLWQRFAAAAPLAIAGYNAGEGAVDRWLRERGDLDVDEFIETIPFDETRNYTKRVLASYFAYSWLYDRQHPVPVIPLGPARDAAKPPPATKHKSKQ